MMAAKYGVDDVTAIDISQEAVEVAKANCIKNACASVKVQRADVQTYHTKRQYDFVCANIITQDLIRMAEKIVSLVRPGKYLAVSGISLKGYAIFRKVYTRYPLRCVKIEKGEGWVGVLFKKTKTQETRNKKYSRLNIQ